MRKVIEVSSVCLAVFWWLSIAAAFVSLSLVRLLLPASCVGTVVFLVAYFWVDWLRPDTGVTSYGP